MVPLQQPGGRNCRPQECQPFGARVDQPRAPRARIPGDHQTHRPLVRQALECREHAGVLVPPTDEWRLRAAMAAPPAAPLPLSVADAGCQLAQRAARWLAEVALQALGEIVKARKRAGRVAVECGAAQAERDGRLAVRIQREGAPGEGPRLDVAIHGELVFGPSDEQLGRVSADAAALGFHPRVERRRVVDMEPFEEVAAEELQRTQLPCPTERLELEGVDLQPLGVQLEHVAVREQAFGAERAT